MTFQELLEAGFIEHHKCGACGVAVGYSVHHEVAAAVFNSGCGCSGEDNYRLITHSELKELKLPEATNAE